MSPIVVVGAGIGGVRTAQRLRARGYTGVLTVLGAEPHLPYNRPPLSKDVLGGGDLPTLLKPEVDAALDVDWRLGVTATGLDTDRRSVMTDAGDVPYDRLVLASGAAPRTLPGLPGVVLRTWDDALRLRERFAPGRVVAMIGAGVLGCEIAASAGAAGCTVHLIDAEPAPMTRVLGSELAAEVAVLHADAGVRLHLGVTAAADEQWLVLSDGARIDADVVVQAVGAVPDIGWLADSGIALADGIVCDTRGRTSADGVSAVGDAAAWAGRRREHWTSATEQADAVAADLTGQDLPAGALPYWWSDQHGVKLQGLGETSDEVWLGRFGPKARRVALYARDGVLVGVVGFAAPAAVMGLRAAIEQGAQVTEVAFKFDATPNR